MTRQRLALYLLLAAVGAAAAVLSFSALRDLASMCGFSDRLAWLLPVTIDAGAAASSLVWLGPWASSQARGYGRALAVMLLVGSVGGNALGHGLEAYGARPHWLVVVAVSAIAPAVLGALVHLVVLVGRPESAAPTVADSPAEGVVDEEVDTTELHVVPPTPVEESDDQPIAPDRPTVELPMTDAQIIADVREWAVELRRRPSRDDMLARYRIGATRARRIRNTLGWIDPVDEPDRQPTGAAS